MKRAREREPHVQLYSRKCHAIKFTSTPMLCCECMRDADDIRCGSRREKSLEKSFSELTNTCAMIARLSLTQTQPTQKHRHSIPTLGFMNENIFSSYWWVREREAHTICELPLLLLLLLCRWRLFWLFLWRAVIFVFFLFFLSLTYKWGILVITWLLMTFFMGFNFLFVWILVGSFSTF